MSVALRYPVWQKHSLAAMLEMDSGTMKIKIANAETVIRNRMVDSKAGPEERQAISDALNALRFLNR